MSASIRRRKPMLIGLLIAGTALTTPALAQEAPAESDDNTIVVTATRRNATVQTAPINISAIGTDEIRSRNVGNLREMARLVPGISILDQGSRNNTPIIFRGLNATALSSFDGDTDGGGTVATYVGEVPFFVNLRVNQDMERVEFLLGPQGTLYGAGTLGGAIRYIPKRPQFDAVSGEARAEAYAFDSSDGISTDTGATVNLPLGEVLAFRGSIDYLNGKGFIDQPFAVQQVGVSNPNDTGNYAANMKRLKDVNTDDTISARAAIRFKPSDAFDANLTYYYQKSRTNGRQFSQARLSNFPVALGPYESALRVAEPNERESQLVALEAELDLGFAKLVSASSYGRTTEEGSRDQTDLLIGLEYSYELFPSFTAFTQETGKIQTWTQELRLVSQFDGPFGFIVGGYYNRKKTDELSNEYTPLYAEYLGGVRPDALEYSAPSNSNLRELAAYGELNYQITDAWQVTVGGRYYNYKRRSASATDLPLFETVFNGREPVDAIIYEYENTSQKDNGFLYKVNSSYKFSPDVMVYATASEGYRIGDSNGIVLCQNTGETQNVCGQASELEYKPDKTRNYEVGLKTQWFDRKLTLNIAGYWIEWSDPQVDSATQIGLAPITINGAGARSRGVELSFDAKMTPRFSLRGNFAHIDAELTDLSPRLIALIDPPGFKGRDENGDTLGGARFIDGQPGDRLPGSPQFQGSVFADYVMPVGSDWELGLSYGVYAQDEVLTRVGGRGGGLTLPGFDSHSASVSLRGKGWTFSVYAENLWNAYIETGVRGTPLFDQAVADEDGDPVYARTYGTFVAPPRRVGIKLVKSIP
ncbi:MAG: TonB-dependent receptor [Sphingobium sp.]